MYERIEEKEVEVLRFIRFVREQGRSIVQEEDLLVHR